KNSEEEVLYMIDRYTREEMGVIWAEENKYQAWLEVEILACEAWGKLGVIPKEDIAALRENATSIWNGFLISNRKRVMMLLRLHVLFLRRLARNGNGFIMV